MKKNLLVVFIFGLFVFCKPLHAIEEHTQLWMVSTILEPFSDTSRFKYYLETQLRFIDNPYKFRMMQVLPGIGYQASPNTVLLGGAGWIPFKTLNGVMLHENRIWQQLNWLIVGSSEYILSNRLRLEERRLTTIPGIALRLRERLFDRIPFQRWPGHSLSMFDEVFLNINHPSWVIQHVFEQNSAFIGIGTQLLKNTILDIGYMNQYVASNPRQMSNVLVLNLSVIS